MSMQTTLRLAYVAVLGVWALAACQRGEAAARLPQLDDFALAAPAGVGEDYLLVFRFEVTREGFDTEFDDETADLPATGMTRAEAADWCARRGLRLPTRREWLSLQAQSGEVGMSFGEANTLELGLGAALPVGAFEVGPRTGLGLYDLQGNVWEWLASDPDDVQEAGAGQQVAEHAGGSFASFRPARGDPATRVCDPNERFSDVGFRPVVNATEWLANEVKPLWLSAGQQERERMQLSIQRWRSDLRTQLARAWVQKFADDQEFADFLLAETPEP